MVESIYIMQCIKKKYCTAVESVNKKDVPLGDHAFSLSMNLNTSPTCKNISVLKH